MLETLFINILSTSTIASIVFLLIMIARKCIKNKVNQENTSLLWIICPYKKMEWPKIKIT